MLLICMPIAGWLYRYVDARALVLFGIGVICWSYYDLSHLSLDAGFWNLVPMLLIMGMGMPFMFVTLSTISLSTVARESMTEASSIYTLARRVGGNMGYALVATLVSRGQQIHRTNLVGHISSFDPNFLEFQHRLTGSLAHAGANPQIIQKASLAISNLLVNRQATMLAYNDVSLIFGLLFLATIPLVFFLPKGKPQ
jgi:DHA2 family multidrug resistance protein